VCMRVCVCVYVCRTPPANNGYLEVVDHKAALIESTIPNGPASALAANRLRLDFGFVLFQLLVLVVATRSTASTTVTSVQTKVIWQKAASPTCYPSRLRIDSSDLDPHLIHVRARVLL